MAWYFSREEDDTRNNGYTCRQPLFDSSAKLPCCFELLNSKVPARPTSDSADHLPPETRTERSFLVSTSAWPTRKHLPSLSMCPPSSSHPPRVLQVLPHHSSNPPDYVGLSEIMLLDQHFICHRKLFEQRPLKVSEHWQCLVIQSLGELAILGMYALGGK